MKLAAGISQTAMSETVKVFTSMHWSVQKPHSHNRNKGASLLKSGPIAVWNIIQLARAMNTWLEYAELECITLYMGMERNEKMLSARIRLEQV